MTTVLFFQFFFLLSGKKFVLRGNGSVTPENPVTKIPEQDGYRVGKKSFFSIFKYVILNNQFGKKTII